MTEKSPYQVLGIGEDASFEEIQAARDLLLSSTGADERVQESIEQAYDLILMQRLRLRKEGKIAVPDRIRFAEREVNTSPESIPASVQPPKALESWLGRWLDTPNMTDVLLPGGILAGLCLWEAVLPSAELPSLQLAMGLLVSIYFLYRKEHHFIRSILLAMLGLSVGLVAAYGAASRISAGDPSGVLLLGLTFIVMWLVTAFLR
jgi:hypothetical protein